jgi:hypothetical protein
MVNYRETGNYLNDNHRLTKCNDCHSTSWVARIFRYQNEVMGQKSLGTPAQGLHRLKVIPGIAFGLNLVVGALSPQGLLDNPTW